MTANLPRLCAPERFALLVQPLPIALKRGLKFALQCGRRLDVATTAATVTIVWRWIRGRMT
jgi:hypothetical protein